MDTLPPPHLFSDPNERLLASAFPPPPAPMGVRTARAFVRLSRRQARRLGGWLRSASESLPLLLACGGIGIALGAYWGAPARAEPALVTAVLQALREAPLAKAAPPAPEPPSVAQQAASPEVVAEPTTPCSTSARALAANEDAVVASGEVAAAAKGSRASRSVNALDDGASRKHVLAKGRKKPVASGAVAPHERAKSTRARPAAKRASNGARSRPRAANAAGLRAVVASK
ncbi:MAG TPA: hypothetical protein VMG12_29615 [Polyangiaceae bacterium]|nr:hypothetical protein [Polyangiaceae bacterium]